MIPSARGHGAGPGGRGRVGTMMLIETLAEAHAVLAQVLGEAERAVVLTGAGLSTQSGIPDYRSPGGIWSQMEPITYQDFTAREDARLEDWRRRFMMAKQFAAAEPNAAHHAITKLVTDGPVELVVTQNIDGLHRRAGLSGDALIEIHGSGDHASCLSCGLVHEIAEAEAAIEATGRAPRCRACGGVVKAAVVSFGQAMPQEDLVRCERAARTADLFIAAGTSLVVYPVAALTMIAKAHGARLVILSLTPTEQDGSADFVIRTPLSQTFEPWIDTI